jgi:hypothetical protein
MESSRYQKSGVTDETALRTESWLMKHNPERRSKQALVVIALSTATIVVCFSLLILQ